MSSALNLLLINHYAGSPQHGMEFRPYYLAKEWVRLGHRVTIVAASCSHVRQQAPIVRGQVTEQDIDGIRYIWLRTPAYDRNGWKRALNMFAFIAQLYRYRHRVVGEAKPDAVIASSTYPLDIYPARRIARRAGARLIFELHDLWPLSLIELGGMSRRHPFTKVIQRAEDDAYRYADHIVSLLPNAYDYMRTRGVPAEKFRHVPNGVDVVAWRRALEPIPADHQRAIESLKDTNRFLVGYAGSFGVANALENLIDAAELLRNERIGFVLVGQGPLADDLRLRIQALNLSNVLILPPIPKRSIPTFLATMDAAFVGWRRCDLYKYGVSPNKLMDYMLAGKPVLHATQAVNDLVHQTRCGITVEPESPRELACAIKRMSGMPRVELDRMGARGKKHVEHHLDYASLAKQFLTLTNVQRQDRSVSCRIECRTRSRSAMADTRAPEIQVAGV